MLNRQFNQLFLSIAFSTIAMTPIANAKDLSASLRSTRLTVSVADSMTKTNVKGVDGTETAVALDPDLPGSPFVQVLLAKTPDVPNEVFHSVKVSRDKPHCLNGFSVKTIAPDDLGLESNDSVVRVVCENKSNEPGRALAEYYVVRRISKELVGLISASTTSGDLQTAIRLSTDLTKSLNVRIQTSD